VLDGVMNPLYEKMGDSYNTKAGAAPDEMNESIQKIKSEFKRFL
jgi:hypothetical protein